MAAMRCGSSIAGYGAEDNPVNEFSPHANYCVLLSICICDFGIRYNGNWS